VHPSLDLLRHPAHSGNFISHNRTLKPPFHTSFTPTVDPYPSLGFSQALAPLSSLSLSLSLSFFLPFFRRTGSRILSSFRPRLFGNPPSSPASAFTSFHPPSFRRAFASLFLEASNPTVFPPSLPLSHPLFLSFLTRINDVTALTVG